MTRDAHHFWLITNVWTEQDPSQPHDQLVVMHDACRTPGTPPRPCWAVVLGSFDVALSCALCGGPIGRSSGVQVWRDTTTRIDPT